jgi:hypothetical protein
MKVARLLLISSVLLGSFLVLFPLTSQAQTGAVRSRVTEAVDAQNVVTLRGNVHPLARPEFDQGVAPDNLPMERMLLVLQRALEQEAALRQLLDDQQVKSSPRFHHWLTPGQLGQQFGPADSDLQAVTDWLAAQGFHVKKVSAGRTIIEFSGTAGLVRQVLGTEFHRYQVNGEDHWANATDPQIPAALAPVVAGFASLNNFPRKPLYKSLGTFSRSKLTGEVHPLFTFPYSNGYFFAVGPSDFATIYNVSPLWIAGTDGTGQTIAVVGETNINIQDVRDFRNMFGLTPNDPNIILNGPDPGINGDETEADLDVQWSGAIAKGATIDFVVSQSTETTAGIDLSALYIVDNNLAPVLSESYGLCEAALGAGGNQFYSTLWEQAAAQGITVLLAAGDSGSAGCDSPDAGETAAQYGLSVSGLASTPFNVAVGGTDFNDVNDPWTYWSQTNNSAQSSALSYIPESTWNDSCAAAGLLGCAGASSSAYFTDGMYLVGGSGGSSSCTTPSGAFPGVTCTGGYAKPSWQSGTGVPDDGARDIPDISLFAGNGLNYSFYVICEMDANSYGGGSSTSCDLNAPYVDFQGLGGTSAPVQMFAAIMGLVNQRYGPQGNANYVLYPMAAQSGATCNSSTAPVTNSSCIFYDVTVGNNSVICQGASPDCSSAASGQYGILVSQGAPAYTTTPGYDLATGLGSVNVANLVNNWTSKFTPSTTTLSLSTSPATDPIKLTHGQPIDFTIHVASGSGTPAGDVSLIAQAGNGANNVTGIGPFTLAGGSVSGSTLMLPGGSYNVTAHYPGNGTFGLSDSYPGIPVTVGKESSQTKIGLVTFDLNGNVTSTNATSAAYGSPYVLRMDVTNSSGQPCASPTTGLISYPCPTGALTVTPAPTEQNPPTGTVPGSYTLNSQGYAEDQPIQMSGGHYNFVASYAGDNSYNASTSPTDAVTITTATTTMDISVQPTNTFASGQTAYLQSYVYTHSNAAPLGGTVTYYMGSTPLQGQLSIFQNPTLDGYQGLNVTFDVPLTGLGPVTITGKYSGDANYAPATSPPLAITLTDFSMTPNPSSINISAPGQSGTSSITLASVNGFSGQVYVSSPTTCPTGASCTVSPSGYVNVATGSSPTVTLTVSTTAPESSRVSPRLPAKPPSLRPLAGWPSLLAGLLILATFISLALARRRPAGWLFMGALLVVGLWVACGGGTSGGGKSPPSLPYGGLSPASLNFGDQYLGSTSSAQIVTLSSTGTAPMSITSIVMSGTNPGDFAETSNCSSSLAGGSNCAINVTFTPTAVGNRNADVIVYCNATGGENGNTEASVGGVGIQPSSGASLSPGSLTFSSQNENTTSSPQTVTLTNNGSTALNISLIDTEGPNSYDFSQTNNCGNSVAAGKSCTISVKFVPITTGTCIASLGIYEGTSGAEQIVNLNGTALPPATPPGAYTVSVQASSMGDVHTLNIPVTVQ